MRILTIAFLAAAACAQSQAPDRIEFEVASIKPGDPLNPGSTMHSSPGGIDMRNTTLRNCILNAYHLNPYQVDGGPKWAESARFDIIAKIPSGARRDQIPQMMQSLLADRFQLQFHREVRNLPVYQLV